MIDINNVKKVYCDEVEIGPLNIKIPKAGLTSLIGRTVQENQPRF